jgi:hypothetical protein
MVWMPSRLSSVLVLAWLRRVWYRLILHMVRTEHGLMVECPEHLHHLRSQAPVLSAKEKYGEHQAVVHTTLGLDRDILALEEAVLECAEKA